MKINRASASPGYTLIEILVVLSIMSIVLISIGAVMHHLSKLDRQLRRDISEAGGAMRLSMQLRTDAHDAVDFSVAGEGMDFGTARFTMAAGSTVEYESRPSVIYRRVLQGDRQLGQQLYRLTGLVRVNWQAPSETSLVELTLTRHHGRIAQARDSKTTETIVAAFGLRRAGEEFE